MTFERVTINPAQMGGVPCIRGLRITVAAGMTTVEFQADFPDLKAADITGALRWPALNALQ